MNHKDHQDDHNTNIKVFVVWLCNNDIYRSWWSPALRLEKGLIVFLCFFGQWAPLNQSLSVLPVVVISSTGGRGPTGILNKETQNSMHYICWIARSEIVWVFDSQNPSKSPILPATPAADWAEMAIDSLNFWVLSFVLKNFQASDPGGNGGVLASGSYWRWLLRSWLRQESETIGSPWIPMEDSQREEETRGKLCHPRHWKFGATGRSHWQPLPSWRCKLKPCYAASAPHCGACWRQECELLGGGEEDMFT